MRKILLAATIIASLTGICHADEESDDYVLKMVCEGGSRYVIGKRVVLTIVNESVMTDKGESFTFKRDSGSNVMEMKGRQLVWAGDGNPGFDALYVSDSPPNERGGFAYRCVAIVDRREFDPWWFTKW